MGHEKNYVPCSGNYIRHNFSYIRPFFVHSQSPKKRIVTTSAFRAGIFLRLNILRNFRDICNFAENLPTAQIHKGTKIKGHECFTIQALLPVILTLLFLLNLLKVGILNILVLLGVV